MLIWFSNTLEFFIYGQKAHEFSQSVEVGVGSGLAIFGGFLFRLVSLLPMYPSIVSGKDIHIILFVHMRK